MSKEQYPKSYLLDVQTGDVLSYQVNGEDKKFVAVLDRTASKIILSPSANKINSFLPIQDNIFVIDEAGEITSLDGTYIFNDHIIRLIKQVGSEVARKFENRIRPNSGVYERIKKSRGIGIPYTKSIITNMVRNRQDYNNDMTLLVDMFLKLTKGSNNIEMVVFLAHFIDEIKSLQKEDMCNAINSIAQTEENFRPLDKTLEVIEGVK